MKTKKTATLMYYDENGDFLEGIQLSEKEIRIIDKLIENLDLKPETKTLSNTEALVRVVTLSSKVKYLEGRYFNGY